MTIYNSEGVVIYEAPITKSTIIKRVLMGDYYIELSFDAVDRIDVGRGSYILYNGQKFEIMDNVLPEDTNTGGLRYTLRFEAQQSQMKRCKVFWRDDANLEVSFSNTTSLSQFGSLIVKNVNAFLGGNNWSLGSYPQDLEKTLKTISFNGDFCWDAVNKIAETFGVEWWTEENGDNVSLCFGKLEHGEEVEFRRGEIVSSIPSKRGDSSNYGTRFYVFGSTKNLPEDYSSTTEGGITNHIVEKRLHLPDGINYIDAWPNIKQEDIVEQVVFFDDIFPTNVDTITNINTKYEEIVEGLSGQVYSVYCEDTPFTIDNIIDGEQIQATFTSGELSGQTFDIEVNQSTSDKWFRIVPNILDADSGTYIPNARTLKPQIGDTFILTGITLPEGRVKEAEQLLLEAGTEYAQKNSNDTEVYDCPTNAIYCHNNDCNFSLGQRVKLIGDKFKDGRSSRIQGYEKRLYDEYQAVYTVGDNSAYSRLGAVEKAIQKSEYSDRTGLEANLIRSKSDNTIPSDYNVYSALATEKYFLNKNKGGVVKGKTDFDGGLSILGQDIIYDPVKKAWEFKGDVVVTGAITMFGSLSGFQPSTVTEAVEVDGETIVKTKNSLGQWQLTAIGGGSGTGGGISAAEVNILIENALKPYIKIATADDKYALISTVSGINSRLSAVETFFATEDSDTLINKWSEIVAFLNATEGDTLDNILATKANQSALDAAVASLTTEIGKKWTQNDAKISNWDSAYDWGNHANAGYAAKTYVDAELAKYVKLATAQKIDAQHNFVNGLQIGGLPITKSASANNTIYLDANLVVSGAITMFGSGSTTFPTIWANIPFNLEHMSWDGSQWNVIVEGGSGSGSLDTNAVNVLISEYLTQNSYATISDISSALVGYATQSWVGDNYLSKSGRAAIDVDEFIGITVKSTDAQITRSAMVFIYNDAFKAQFGWDNYEGRGTFLYNYPSYKFLGIKDDGTPYYDSHTLVHTGNIGFCNAGSATKLANPRSIWGQSFDGTEKITHGFRSLYADSYNGGVAHSILNNQGSPYGLLTRIFRNGSVSLQAQREVNDAECFNLLLNHLGGNVAIGGTTADAKLHVHGNSRYEGYLYTKDSFVNTLARDYSGPWARGVEWIGIGDTINASIAAYSNNSIIEYINITANGDFSNLGIRIYNSGLITLGGDTTINGNLITTGVITMFSQLSMKNVIDYDGLSLEQLAQIKPVRFTWKDGRDSLVHAGGIADEVMQILPEVVHRTKDDKLTMDYGSAGFFMAASLIKPVVDHEQRLQSAEKEIKNLRAENKRLREQLRVV